MRPYSKAESERRVRAATEAGEAAAATAKALSEQLQAELRATEEDALRRRSAAATELDTLTARLTADTAVAVAQAEAAARASRAAALAAALAAVEKELGPAKKEAETHAEAARVKVRDFLRSSRDSLDIQMTEAKGIVAKQRAEFETDAQASRVGLEGERIRHAERTAGEREKYAAEWKKQEAGYLAEAARKREKYRQTLEAEMDEDGKAQRRAHTRLMRERAAEAGPYTSPLFPTRLT